MYEQVFKTVVAATFGTVEVVGEYNARTGLGALEVRFLEGAAAFTVSRIDGRQDTALTAAKVVEYLVVEHELDEDDQGDFEDARDFLALDVYGDTTSEVRPA